MPLIIVVSGTNLGLQRGAFLRCCRDEQNRRHYDMKLYDYPDCLFAQKVRVVLTEKELEFESILVDFE